MEKCLVVFFFLFFYLLSGSISLANPLFTVDELKICQNYATSLDECKSIPMQDGSVDIRGRRFSSDEIYFVAAIRISEYGFSKLRNRHYLSMNVGCNEDGTRFEPIPVGIFENNWRTNGRAYRSEFDRDSFIIFTTNFSISLNGSHDILISFQDYALDAIPYSSGGPARVHVLN